MKILIIFIFLFLLSSCGKKAPPIPIEKSIPQQPEITYEPTPFGINIWINLPEKTEGGYPLNKIKFIEIEKKEEPLRGDSKGKIKKIKLKTKLHSAGRYLLFTDSELKPAHKYTYRIKLKKDFLVETPYYGEQTLYWTYPPSAVRNITLILSSSEELILKWDAPTENIQGGPLIAEPFYSVERIQNGNLKYFNVKETYFKERVSSKERICYRVRPILDYFGTLIPGPYSEKLCYP